MSSSNLYPENERPVEAFCDNVRLHVKLADDRTVSTPLWWYPRLLNASPEQRNKVELMLDGVHWPDIDEDLSVRGMLSGWKYTKAIAPHQMAAE
jgi:hypothetical protein